MTPPTLTRARVVSADPADPTVTLIDLPGLAVPVVVPTGTVIAAGDPVIVGQVATEWVVLVKL